jgi:undecaprenol kinase
VSQECDHTTASSFRCALEGIRHAYRTQRNLRIQLAVASCVVALGSVVGVSRYEWVLLVLTFGLVLSGEIFNTAVENLVDLVCPSYHPLARVVKDLMAGSVLLLSASSVVVGVLILGPPLWAWVFGR